MAIAATPLLLACGGGSPGAPGAIASAQCSGPTCPVQGPPPQGAGAAPLCPATADIGSSTYLGGAGSGEVVRLNINAVAMTYTLTWLESPIPAQPVNVQPTRQGVSISGVVSHPPTGFLPTAEQTRCAFILQPATGTTPAGGTTPYSTTSTFNAQNPPMILIGQGGVAGGGIPGAEISFPGTPNPLDPTNIVFPVPDRIFDFYPFIGFATTDSTLADLQGTYNALAYHIRPSDTYGAIGVNAVETFDATGNCTSPTACITTGGSATGGTPWTPVASSGYFTSTNAPQLLPPPSVTLGSLVFPFSPQSPAYMILGKVNGTLVPVVVRAGIADPANLAVDDESGIAMLAPATAVASGGIDGGYVGADSNFKYTATLIKGGSASFVNPSTATAESSFALQYGLSSPGLVGATDAQANPGFVIAAGGLYAVLLQGVENGGITASSAIIGQPTSSVPYFGIGAQISK
ncbi:hypothetical protein P3T43_001016 [Paraburkholderia sp. GAS41]|jgi:hypothetical protein|uniref:DUF2957 domain-containing protein n=1 Tax=Paraburkholderia sp. GAS41 TaxID=3035134 RepID=UPI003D249C0D